MPIRVNGAFLSISKNLLDALLDLGSTESQRVIWVDAICINQEDNAERDGQVIGIWAIYQSASRAVILLGPGTKTTPKAFELMRRLHENVVEAKKLAKPVERWKGKGYDELVFDGTHQLSYYLLRTRGRGATDAWGRTFAVLGLVGDGIKELGILPNYEATVEDTYREATASIITISRGFDILGVCFSFKGRFALPSWVPDWGSQ